MKCEVEKGMKGVKGGKTWKVGGTKDTKEQMEEGNKCVMQDVIEAMMQGCGS